MRLSSPWTPWLADAQGPISERIANALAEDIANGVVAGGARLPPHRDLAYRLGVGLGTATKAYATLERRGFVESVRGRGMFVIDAARPPADGINLSVNTPPQMVSDRLLSATLAGLSKRLNAGAFGAYAPPAGRREHRALLAKWLATQGLEAAPDQLLICHGAQQALALSFGLACRPGSLLLTEAATYPGALSIARELGQPIQGLALDAEGARPDALEEGLSRAGAGAVLYVTPTLQNPTGATMGLERRRAVAQLCRAHDALIIEDDVYSIFAPPGLPTIASLAPERSFHVSGLSKSISPGLRIGTLVVPPGWVDAAHKKLQTSSTTASTLACLMMEQWLQDGTAESVVAAIRADAAQRTALARSLLGPRLTPGGAPGYHVWLPMPIAAAESLTQSAAALGIALLPPRAAMVDPAALDGGVRFSLGPPPIDALRRALTMIAKLLKPANRSAESYATL